MFFLIRVDLGYTCFCIPHTNEKFYHRVTNLMLVYSICLFIVYLLLDLILYFTYTKA